MQVRDEQYRARLDRKTRYSIIGTTCILVIMGICACSVCASERKETELLPQGEFKQNGKGMPQDWLIPDWMQKYVSVKPDDDSPYLHMKSTSKKDKHTISVEDILLPNNHSGRLRVSTYIKSKNLEKGDVSWQTAAVEVIFQKAQERLGQVRLNVEKDFPQWEHKEKIVDIPKGADRLRVRIGFWQAKGILDVKKLNIDLVASAPVSQSGPPIID